MAARPSLCQTCVGGVSSSGGGDRWVGGGIKEVSSVRIFFIKCLEHFEALTQVLQLEIRGTCAIYKNLAQSAFRLIFIKCLEHFEALTQVLQLEIRGVPYIKI